MREKCGEKIEEERGRDKFDKGNTKEREQGRLRYREENALWEEKSEMERDKDRGKEGEKGE